MNDVCSLGWINPNWFQVILYIKKQNNKQTKNALWNKYLKFNMFKSYKYSICFGFHELIPKYVKPNRQKEFRILEEKCGQHFNLLRLFFQKSFNFLPQSKNTHYWLTGDSNLPQIQSVWLKGGLIWVGVCEGHPHHPSQRQMDSRCSR